LVRWIFEASPGDVSEPFNISDKYVVAIVTEANKEGTMSPAKARATAEPLLRNQKKAEMIIKKIGNASTLEAIAAATAQQVRKSDSVSFSTPYIPNLGQEGKVVGMSFDKALTGKAVSPLIEGNAGVFAIKVDNVSAKASLSADLAQAQKAQEQMQESIFQRQAVDALRKDASIKDNRGKFY
jgi:peptidyl-prolyl cis-trans isomerase D